jgi:hypothetical protein
VDAASEGATHELLEIAVSDASHSMAAMRLASPPIATRADYLDPRQQPLLSVPNTFAPLVEKLKVFASLVSLFGEVCLFILMPNDAH